MRYSTPLRSSRRHHILKHRSGGGLISFAWLVAILVVLLVTVNYTQLDARQLFAGFTLSFLRTTLAYCIALGFALCLALILSAHPLIENLLLPVLDVLQSFPSFALFPVLVHALKNSPETVIVTVLVITMVWPIIFSIIGGIKNRRQDLEEAATIYGAKGLNRVLHFTLPELLPSIVTGSIVGWGEGWEFIIGAELLVQVQSGIGHYLGFLGDTNQNGLLAVGIVVLMILLFIINKVFWLNLLHKVTQYEAES